MSHDQKKPAARARRSRLAVLVTALACALPLSGCAHEEESVVLVGGDRVDATVIDRDPLALLPSGVLLVGYVDAASMFTTNSGTDVSRIARDLVPLGPEANFVPSRDVVRIFTGIYAMQGADFCSVVQGNFDVDRIRTAADARVATPRGTPLVKTRYAGNDIYTSANVGFVVLTSHSVLSGNETGMRRALDRIRFGKLERSITPWMVDLMLTPGASFAIAGDLTSQSAGAAAQQLPFLNGLRLIRTIGNFKPPGINFAGTLTYADQQAANTGASTLQNLQSIAKLMSFFGGSAPALQVGQQGSDVAFTYPVDDRTVHLLLGTLANLIESAAPR
jgi:hypothetical protein